MNKMIFLFIAAFPGIAGAALFEGVERNDCFKHQSDYHIAYECLSKKAEKSSLLIDKVIKKTNEKILKENDGPVFGSEDPNETIGELYSKHFISAQESWKKYKNELCLGVGSQIGKDTLDYQSFIDQCEINLNKNHLTELNMMDISSPPK